MAGRCFEKRPAGSESMKPADFYGQNFTSKGKRKGKKKKRSLKALRQDLVFDGLKSSRETTEVEVA